MFLVLTLSMYFLAGFLVIEIFSECLSPRELTHSFSTLASQVDSAKVKVKDKLAELNEEINRLEEIETKAKIYR